MRFRGRCSSRMWSIQSSAVSSVLVAERCIRSKALTRLSAIVADLEIALCELGVVVAAASLEVLVWMW